MNIEETSPPGTTLVAASGTSGRTFRILPGRPDSSRDLGTMSPHVSSRKRGRSTPVCVGGSWADRPEAERSAHPACPDHNTSQPRPQSQIQPSPDAPSPPNAQPRFYREDRACTYDPRLQPSARVRQRLTPAANTSTPPTAYPVARRLLPNCYQSEGFEAGISCPRAKSNDGRYWARTSDLRLVEAAKQRRYP